MLVAVATVVAAVTIVGRFALGVAALTVRKIRLPPTDSSRMSPPAPGPAC